MVRFISFVQAFEFAPMSCNKSRSASALVVGCLAVGLLNVTQANAAQTSCPIGISKFAPQDGDLYFASAANNLQRYRAGRAVVEKPIALKPDDHISLYYFTAPEALATPMVFALIRAYEMRKGQSTSLKPTDVVVSNSMSSDKLVPTAAYTYFHEERRKEFSPLRTEFHMRFEDGGFFSNNWDNSYDDVSNPEIYALPKEPKGAEYSGFKAYMQRVAGFPGDGRCVAFDLFDHKSFAYAVDSVSMVLIALADKSNKEADRTGFSVKFLGQR